MREMEERRQAAALREAEDKAKPLKPGRKRKDREELAESKGVNSRTNKVSFTAICGFLGFLNRCGYVVTRRIKQEAPGQGKEEIYGIVFTQRA